MTDVKELIQYKVVGHNDENVWFDNGKEVSITQFISMYNMIIDYYCSMAEELDRRLGKDER